MFLAKISNKCLKIALFHFQIGFKEYIQKKKKKAKKITGKKTLHGRSKQQSTRWKPTSICLVGGVGCSSNSWAKYKKPTKNQIEKIVKLNDHIYACNSLRNLECEAHAMTGNGNYVNLDIFLEKFVNLFSADFSGFYLELLCGGCA